MSKANKKSKYGKDQKRSGFFALIYVYILVVILVIGILYSENMSNMEKASVPPPLPDTTQTKQLTIQEPQMMQPANLAELVKPSSDLINEGQKIFQTVCVSCHGADGKGDGPAAASLNPHPRNFTSKDNWVNGPTLSGIFETLQNGISGSGMVSFDNYSTEQKFALAHYIRSTFVPNPPKVDQDKINDLDQKYNLSKGGKKPGQIPVADAMRIMEQGAKPEINKLETTISQIENDSTNAGSKIFDNIAKNKLDALTSLDGNTNWVKDENAFVNIIVNNVNQNGFNEKVFLMSKDDWNTFYRYMSKYF
jgi:mono/diheme cytochrome c family protein